MARDDSLSTKPVRTAGGWACLLMALMLGACDAPTRPGAEALEFSAQLSSSRVTAGTAVTLTGRLTNVGAETLELTFPTPCYMDVEVTQLATGDDVSPAQGCAQVITRVVLAPGETLTRTVTLATATTAVPQERLGPGTYSVVGAITVRELGHSLTSPPLALTVE